MTRPRQPRTCSHPIYAQTLTMVHQVYMKRISSENVYLNSDTNKVKNF